MQFEESLPAKTAESLASGPLKFKALFCFRFPRLLRAQSTVGGTDGRRRHKKRQHVRDRHGVEHTVKSEENREDQGKTHAEHHLTNQRDMAGGLVRLFMDKRKYKDEKEKNDCIQSGILYTSGMIAGEGVVGILLAVFAVLGINLDLSGTVRLGNIGALVLFAALLMTIILFASKAKKTGK